MLKLKLLIIRSSLLASTLGLVANTVLAKNAVAQSVDVPFNGTVPGACNFNTPTPGALAVNDTFKPTMLLGGTSLGGTIAKGRSGFVQVVCNTPANVTINEPVQTRGFQFNIKRNFASAVLTGANGDVINTTGTSTLPIKAGITNFQVRMETESDQVIPPGNYEFYVTLTITP
ncbi:MAG TPA: hypothetical protein V6D14_09875 [Coleofasciculaceae cyanobacterium]|jgi:hypothetical protein